MEKNSLIGEKNIQSTKAPLDLSPVFVVGAGRSGTTLIYKILCLHPEISWISNYVNRFPDFPILSILNKAININLRLCLSIWFGKESNAYFNRKLLSRVFPMPAEGEIVYSYCGIPVFPNKEWKITDAQKKCIVRAFNRIRRFQGAILFLTKRTANNRRIPQLHEAFPDAKFIHIIRDGRAVAKSLLNVEWWANHQVWWWNKKTPNNWVAEGKDPLEMAARNWVEEIKEIQMGLKNVPSSQIIEVRYEDLSKNTIDIVTRIVKFIGIDCPISWLNAIRTLSIFNKSKDRIKSTSKYDNEILHAIQSEVLKRLGYLD